MTFYVNAVNLPECERRENWHNRFIGLFDSNKWDGRGSCCGYYGAEYYLDTTLLAYGIQLGQRCKIYKPKYPFDGGFFSDANKHFDEIKIGSGMWERTFEADSVEEAIKIFETQSW